MTTAEKLKAIEDRILEAESTYRKGYLGYEEFARLRSFLCRRAVAVLSEPVDGLPGRPWVAPAE